MQVFIQHFSFSSVYCLYRACTSQGFVIECLRMLMQCSEIVVSQSLPEDIFFSLICNSEI
jgi:hypothetical protein